MTEPTTAAPSTRGSLRARADRLLKETGTARTRTLVGDVKALAEEVGVEYSGLEPTLAAVESPAEGALRGVNEVLRFVQALDKVDVEGVEPMWTVLDDEHAARLRADEVAGARGRRRAAPKASSPTEEAWVLDGTRAEEGEHGWAASDRDELVGLAPDSSRAPFYVAAGTTAGTDDE